MKIFLLLCFVALSRANLLDEISNLKETNVFTFIKGELTKLEEVILKPLEEKAFAQKRESSLTGLAGNVKQEMLTFIDKIKGSVEGAETIATNLEATLKAAAQGLKDGKDIKALAQMVLDTLEKDVEAMLQKGTFDVDVGKMIDEIVPSAVSKLVTKHSRRFLLNDLINGLKDTLTDTIGLLSGTAFGDLKTFLGGLASSATSLLTPTLGNLKNLAEAFLSHAGQATASIAMQAVKFFQPFQTQLGSVFTQIKNVAATLTGQSIA